MQTQKIIWIPTYGEYAGKELTGVCRGEDYFIWWDDPEITDMVTIDYLRRQELQGFGKLSYPKSKTEEYLDAYKESLLKEKELIRQLAEAKNNSNAILSDFITHLIINEKEESTEE